MHRRVYGAICAALIVVGLGGCAAIGIEDVNMNNSVPVFQKTKRVINGITYTKTEYTDGSFEYSGTITRPRATPATGAPTQITAARPSMWGRRELSAQSKE